MHQNKVSSCYDYVCHHTDVSLIVAANAQEIIDSSMKFYEVRNPGPPAYHLGCNYSKVFDEWEEYWCIGSSTHVRKHS